MDFKELLIAAKANAPEAQKAIFEMYRPLLVKGALVDGNFDEDLYQELQSILLNAIKVFII